MMNSDPPGYRPDSMSQREKDVLFVDLYEGAHGLTLRLHTQSGKGLATLRELFSKLSETATTRDVAAVPGIYIARPLKLILESRPGASDFGRTFRLVGYEGDVPSFCWTKSPEGWTDSLGLVEGVLNAERPGGQYLTSGGVDDALVELSFREDS